MFIGIFGIESKQREVKEFSNVVCPSCGLTRSVLFEQFMFFHFFFIPLFKWDRKFFLKLRCGCVYELDREYFEEIKKSEELDFSRMRKIFSEDKVEYKKCLKCGKSFIDSYSYCPYCGDKL